MMKRLALSLVAASLVAGCGKTDEPAPQPAKEIIVRSEAQKELFTLNQLNRAIALKRAIRDFGPGCVRITKSGYVGRYKDMDYWTATCQDDRNRDRDWALFIGANDTVQVRLCEDVAKVGLPACAITKDEMIHEAPATKAAG